MGPAVRGAAVGVWRPGDRIEQQQGGRSGAESQGRQTGLMVNADLERTGDLAAVSRRHPCLTTWTVSAIRVQPCDLAHRDRRAR